MVIVAIGYKTTETVVLQLSKTYSITMERWENETKNFHRGTTKDFLLRQQKFDTLYSM